MSKTQASFQNQSLDTDDALNPKFNAAALDLLLIELIETAQRVTEQVLAREKALLDEYRRSRVFNPQNDSISQKESDVVTNGTANGDVTCLGFPAVSTETQEGMLWRLDGMGYRVGQGLVER